MGEERAAERRGWDRHGGARELGQAGTGGPPRRPGGAGGGGRHSGMPEAPGGEREGWGLPWTPGGSEDKGSAQQQQAGAASEMPRAGDTRAWGQGSESPCVSRERRRGPRLWVWTGPPGRGLVRPAPRLSRSHGGRQAGARRPGSLELPPGEAEGNPIRVGDSGWAAGAGGLRSGRGVAVRNSLAGALGLRVKGAGRTAQPRRQGRGAS